MLYIIISYPEGDVERTWHVGEENKIDARAVTEVQADGDELEMIQVHMQGLPKMQSGRVVRWFGDHAKFIAANLR